MTPEQAYDLAKDLGPMLLAVIGALFSSLLSFALVLARYGWKLHTKRMELMATGLTKLAQGISKAEAEHSVEHQKVWESIQGLRAELHMATQRLEHSQKGLMKVEGALDKQVDRVDSFLKLMGKVESKLDAIFKYMDAPKRASDQP